MGIQGVIQPEKIQITPSLRLKKYDGIPDTALGWYQDEETVWLVDGVRNRYSVDRLGAMYRYLRETGELYFIEALEGEKYRPIGDVTFWQEDMPIVIGDPSYRGQGIGRKVIEALVQRGRDLGYDRLRVGEIYDWNEASKRCFESVGFRMYEKTAKGGSYYLNL